MPAFLFQAKTPDGKFVKGEVEAGSESEARVRIRAQRLVPMKIVSKGGAAKKTGGTKPLEEKKSLLDIKFGGGVKPQELQVFTRQFATLINSGVPVVQSLEAMIGPGRSPELNSALKSILAEVGKGRRLAECMRNHPLVFDHMYVNLVHAGEEGGVLDTILERLAQYIEKSVKLKNKVKSAMFYPIAVLVVAFLVIAGIMLFVIPSFVKMFEESGMELPWLTVKVIEASNFFSSYWYVIFGIFFMIPFAYKAYYGTPGGRKNYRFHYA